MPAAQSRAQNLVSSGVMLKVRPTCYARGQTHAQKKRCSVAIGLFSSRDLRRSCSRNLERRSSRRIACDPDGSGTGADSREVDFDDQEAGCQNATGCIFA
jgi:hypothetical protein